MSHDIFISYSRRDLAAVKPIKEELEAQGFSCWMDLEGIESGSEEFTECIVAAIGSSSAVLFFLSESSQSSEWSLKELRFAKTSKKRVVLIRINDDAMTPVFSFNFGGSDIIDWRIPEQRLKLIHDLSVWTGRKIVAPPLSRQNDSVGATTYRSYSKHNAVWPQERDVLPAHASRRLTVPPLPRANDEIKMSDSRKGIIHASAVSAPILILMIVLMSNYDEFSDKMEVFWILFPLVLYPIAGLVGAFRDGTIATFSRRMWKGFAILAGVNVVIGVFCGLAEAGESTLIDTFGVTENIASFILAKMLFWKKRHNGFKKATIST